MVMIMTVRLNNIWLHIVFSHILGPGLNQQLKKFILFVTPIMRPYSSWNLRNYLRLAHKSSSKFFSSAKRELEIFPLPEPETRSEGLWESLKLPVKVKITALCQTICLASIISDVTNNKKRTLKIVRLTSFQNPQFQSACSSLPAFVFTVLLIASLNLLSSYFYVSLNFMAVPTV